jgi:hypothetical protein
MFVITISTLECDPTAPHSSAGPSPPDSIVIATRHTVAPRPLPIKRGIPLDPPASNICGTNVRQSSFLNPAWPFHLAGYPAR